jgi:hypothetical protein
MSFSPLVAETVLVDCGRHCSICHKFCGTKIELHHIIPKDEDGDDTHENCIPLCFDCHAEVKAYNSKHPKGKKYTASELKAHRDRWYEKVKKSYGVTANPDYVELDRKVFSEIREILPSDKGSIVFLRFHDYSASFPSAIHDDLRNFMIRCIRPEFEFIDMDLEGLRTRLANSIGDFLEAIGLHTYPLDGRPDKNGVPKEWGYGTDEQQKEYHKAIAELNQLRTNVYETYDELVRLGRRKLAV